MLETVEAVLVGRLRGQRGQRRLVEARGGWRSGLGEVEEDWLTGGGGGLLETLAQVLDVVHGLRQNTHFGQFLDLRGGGNMAP